MSNYKKILGGFLGAATGDAMGAATETMPIEYIKKVYNGFVKDFYKAPDYVFAAGKPAGSVTDDFSLAFHLAKAIINNKGIINDKVADEAILTWYDEGKYISMMGPSIYECVSKIRGYKKEPYPFLNINNWNATNGGGMKIVPVGLLSNGNIDKAIKDAVTVSKNSHGNSSALSGACAIAAAVSAAIKDRADVYQIVKAGLKGAEYGHDIGTQLYRKLAVPSVSRRINLAIEIALRVNDLEKAMYELRDIIGCGLYAYQSVPTVFGIIMAAKADALESIFTAINMGDDTDTVGTMAGAIVGTLNGSDVFPKNYIEILNNANGFDLIKLSEDFAAL